MPSIHTEEQALEYGKSCYDHVVSSFYYPDENHTAVYHIGKEVKDWTGQDYGEWAQLLWDMLPDSQSIRTGPFFLLCDLAEWYCFGDESGQGHKNNL